MKKILCIVLMIFGLSSVASAQSSSFGVKFGTPFAFALQYGYDFGAINKGFGIRAVFGSTFFNSMGSVGFGADAIFRTPIGQYGSSAFAGISSSVAYLFNNYIPNSSAIINVMVGILLGVELNIGEGWSILFELQPMTFSISSGLYTQFQTLPLLSLGVNVRL